MKAVLAFSAIPAASKLQRARCTRTGRFVAWARAAALRLPAAPAVVPLLPAPAVVVVACTPSPRARVAVVVAVASPLRGAVAAVVAGVRSILARARCALLGRWAM